MRFAPRHGRFLTAFALGVAAGLAAWALSVSPVFALLTTVDAFFLIYLLLTARIVGQTGADDLRRHAEQEDEGVALILLLAVLAVGVSVTAIFLVLNADASGLVARLTALVSLPLGWATLHTLAAFHYAHLHYRGERAGFLFPGNEDPDARDFLYASFTIGMTAQVSDVEVASRPLRRAVLVHGVASFFYNTGILALAVNAAVTAGQ
ncbi:DUF1345 domain-containing protein [Tabrizicola sp.]|uniref:DUF1345 domain-containing protein n=1 Tax=Tabrizicola sp. TaxID=2005166 RepID=UPI002732E4A4|nr:DUF1345 domain-containing protein [Tabrizicola sp.]MDP3196059.1 DUF1345 domain-containing protein [Tabrizicola sp.]